MNSEIISFFRNSFGLNSSQPILFPCPPTCFQPSLPRPRCHASRLHPLLLPLPLTSGSYLLAESFLASSLSPTRLHCRVRSNLLIAASSFSTSSATSHPVAQVVALEVVAKSSGAKLQDRRHHHEFPLPPVDFKLQDRVVLNYFVPPFVSPKRRRSLDFVEDHNTATAQLSPSVASVVLLSWHRSR